MSNEIQSVIQLGCVNGQFVLPTIGTPQSIDQAVLGGGLPGYVIVGTVAVDVDLSALTRPGRYYMRNLGTLGTDAAADPTITYGPKSGALVGFNELPVGEEAGGRFTATTPTLTIISDEDDTAVQLIILED